MLQLQTTKRQFKSILIKCVSKCACVCVCVCVYVHECLWSMHVCLCVFTYIVCVKCFSASPWSFLWGTRKMVLSCSLMERESSLFSSICPLSPTYVMNTHMERKNEETGFVLVCFQPGAPCEELPDLDVSVWLKDAKTQNRNIPMHVYESKCTDEQVHTPTQHTHTHTLPSESTNWWRLRCRWKKKTQSISPPASTQDVTAIDHFPVDTQRQCQHE